MTASDPFGTSTVFVGLDNFTALFGDPTYRAAIWRTLWFCVAVTALAMAGGLLFASFANHQLRGARVYRTLLDLARMRAAPALSAVVWVFMMDPQIGIIGRHLGSRWNYALNGGQAMALVIGASAWKQVSLQFHILSAARTRLHQAIPAQPDRGGDRLGFGCTGVYAVFAR